MSEASKLIKTVGNLFVIGYPLSSLAYLVWMLSTRRILYWDGYNILNGLIIFLIVAGFLPFLVSLFISNLRTGWRILASLLVFPLLCVSAFFWLDLPYYHQVSEIRFDRHKYLLAYHTSIYDGPEGDTYDWYLFECAVTGSFCKPTLLYTDEFGEFYNDASDTNLIIDDTADELHVVIDDDLLYTMGKPPRKYIPMLRSAQRGNYRYNLSYYDNINTDSVVYRLYECDAHYTCIRIPFIYSVPKERAAGIRLLVEIDKTTNEVRVIREFEGGNAEPIFLHGDPPRCYAEGCSIPEE